MAMTEQTKKHSHPELERLFTEAEQCDKDIFAEMRSNLLLIAGEHYQKRGSEFYRRVRNNKDLTEQQKLRLTKNHTQKIVKSYCNNIISQAPGVGFEPKNKNELRDQKAAELHHAVWQFILDEQGGDELVDDWCDDFVGVGEVATKIFWDPDAGPVVPGAFPQKLGDGGEPLTDEFGQPIPDTEKPMKQGCLVYETLYGFNLLRAPEAKSLKKSPHLIIRKMASKDDLIAMFPDKAKMIKESPDETFLVFDGTKGGYRKSENEVLVKEYYFRPCAKYPKGYFFITTKEGTLSEGELPGGVFPIVVQTFDKVQTTPRGRGPVKHMRPYQAEINRAASKIAEHQITLGDDKLLIQNGTTIAPGVALPGVRSINYTGMEPGILAGRDGSQYLNYMQAQITEMYQVMGVAEDMAEKAVQLDPYTMLYRAASQKKVFQRYIKRFERFLVDVTKTSLRLAKHHMPKYAVVYAVGKPEQINIPEFKNSEELCYQIKVTPQADDVETKLGKQLVMNHVLQYVGTQLGKDDIGKVMRAMPYVSDEESFSDLTIDYDTATNDILMLDRGELPPVQDYDNHLYMIKRLTSRMRLADFKTLPPEVQNNYKQKIMLHQQIQVQQEMKIQQAKQGYIPTDGYMVTVDLYVSDPANPMKTRRARIPYGSLAWLIKALEAQGRSLQQLEAMNQGAVAQMSEMALQQQGQMPDGMGAGQGMGAEMPGGSNGHGNQPVGNDFAGPNDGTGLNRAFF